MSQCLTRSGVGTWVNPREHERGGCVCVCVVHTFICTRILCNMYEVCAIILHLPRRLATTTLTPNTRTGTFESRLPLSAHFSMCVCVFVRAFPMSSWRPPFSSTAYGFFLIPGMGRRRRRGAGGGLLQNLICFKQRP